MYNLVYLNYFIRLNGFFDILCALSILKIINISILSKLHLNMIKDYHKKNNIFERFFAYWIFTYGIIRFTCNNILISYSYYIECAFFVNEYLHHSLDTKKGLFTIIISFLLGFLYHIN